MGWGVSVTHRPHSTHGKDPVPIVQEAGWTPGPVWTGAENLALPGLYPRTFQPVASRYTDWATRPTWSFFKNDYKYNEPIIQGANLHVQFSLTTILKSVTYWSKNFTFKFFVVSEDVSKRSTRTREHRYFFSIYIFLLNVLLFSPVHGLHLLTAFTIPSFIFFFFQVPLISCASPWRVEIFCFSLVDNKLDCTKNN
jgi:hypothetical protein